MKPDSYQITETILSIERSANERWNTGDCYGYLDTYSDDITYFDHRTEKLLVGHKAVEEHILKMYKNPHIVRSEYLNPEVAVSDAGDLAVLSYNLRNFVADEKEGEKVFYTWNSTEVYRLIDSKWRIVNSHWSFTRHPAIIAGGSSF
jgi:ketosteroid isomerase-like protein